MKGIGGAFNCLKFLMDFCTSSRQQGMKYQLFDIWFFLEGGLYKYPMNKYIKDSKVLAHLEY
jgi:hypothetical protein